MQVTFRLKHIILADDDADDQVFFETALRQVSPNTTLTIYHDGTQLMNGLTRPEAQRPDVIFLDLNMPKKGGLQCMEEMSQHHELKSIPVVIFTTSGSKQEITKAYNHGAYWFAHKPTELSKWNILIEKVLTLNENPAQPAPDKL